VNDAGQPVGESHPPFGNRPVLWSNDATHTSNSLPLLPGDNWGTAAAINNLGQAVGSSAYSVPGTWDVGPSRPVLWRDDGVFDLQLRLDPLTGNAWTLMTVTGINDAGQIIGTGRRDGKIAGLVLTPLSQ
jgi:uncharacterized membrane protein